MEIFDTLLEMKVLVERWRTHYNTVRPHSSLGYRPPAPEAIQPRLRTGESFVTYAPGLTWPVVSFMVAGHGEVCRPKPWRRRVGPA